MINNTIFFDFCIEGDRETIKRHSQTCRRCQHILNEIEEILEETSKPLSKAEQNVLDEKFLQNKDEWLSFFSDAEKYVSKQRRILPRREKPIIVLRKNTLVNKRNRQKLNRVSTAPRIMRSSKNLDATSSEEPTYFELPDNLGKILIWRRRKNYNVALFLDEPYKSLINAKLLFTREDGEQVEAILRNGKGELENERRSKRTPSLAPGVYDISIMEEDMTETFLFRLELPEGEG